MSAWCQSFFVEDCSGAGKYSKTLQSKQCLGLSGWNRQTYTNSQTWKHHLNTCSDNWLVAFGAEMKPNVRVFGIFIPNCKGTCPCVLFLLDRVAIPTTVAHGLRSIQSTERRARASDGLVRKMQGVFAHVWQKLLK